MTKAFNTPPYFDDYNIEDPNQDNKTVFEKNYHRILFQPSYAVQNRELIQLQTMLQSQIEQFGLGVYEDGTPIINGKTTFQDNIPYIDIDLSANSDVQNAVDNIKFIETRDVYDDVELRAEILNVESIEDQAVNTFRMWLRYTRGGNATNRFAAADNIYLKDDTIPFEDITDQVITDPDPVIGEVSATGVGFSLNVDQGVFFVAGHFVHTFEQNKFYIKTNSSETVTGEAIFNIVESVTTSEYDSTLLDNAAGSPNYSAPGADRYTITLDLGLRTSDTELNTLNSTDIYNTTDDINYIKLIGIKQSLVFEKARTKFSELNDVLAQRTFEESGSYTVNPFLINIREFLNDSAGNNGRYTSA
jgi:head-tail adaptor